ncbi:MAG: hypothetical protein AAFQ91_30840 [Cyanobacteria bacterium J06621_15]
MSFSKFSDEEITQRGKELYDSQIRSQVETPENIGKIVSINIETGEYEIGDDLLITSRRLREKQADALIWAERIGFNAVFAVGGTLIRTEQ